MSTSLLYHAWGTHGYNYLSTRYKKKHIVFVVEPKPGNIVCLECKGSNWIHKGHRWRTLQTLPIGNRKVFLEVKVPRILCYDCEAMNEIDPQFAAPLRTYTIALEKYVIELCRISTIKGVSRITGLDWHTVKSIDKRYLEKKYSNISIRGLRHLAIDEFAVRKGHNYMTSAIDLESGKILYVGDGRDRDAIIPFLKIVRRSRSTNIWAIAIDMSAAYISAVQEIFPEIPIVFDHFHVIKLMNEHLDKLRSRIFRSGEANSQNVIKGIKYLLLMGSEKLGELDKLKPGSKKRLEQALSLNRALNIAYYLKEKLRTFWTLDAEQGSLLLEEWYQEAKDSQLPEMQKMANTLKRHEHGILAYFEHPISTGPLEGINNKIKTLKRQAYGFRDREYFKLRLLSLHESHYALLG